MQLSVVIPVHNEAEVLDELSRRCAAAAASVSDRFEIVIVDDASTDESRTVAMGLPRDRSVRVVSLERNLGQLGATLRGLGEARGEVVVVLDGDLQDPPEAIVDVTGALERTPQADVACAVKAKRDEAAWFVLAAGIYHAWQCWAAHTPVPAGAGSYCAMRGHWAQRAAQVSLKDGNLAAVLAALGARFVTVGYDKAARYDGRSRVGVAGLVREAIGSLALTGALGRTARALAVPVAAGAALALSRGRFAASLGLGSLGVALGATSVLSDGWRRRRLP